MSITRPWSLNQLKRLGACIRDGIEPTGNLPSYDEVMLWYNDLATEVQDRVRSIDWVPLLGPRTPEIASRPKTIDTLRQKLQREQHLQLPSIQDIAGVRFEVEMCLDEQTAVAQAIAGLFGDSSVIKDLREHPHSGYRAVHVIVKLEAPVEVQVRTHLQGHWANVYELAADVFGRGIRYGESAESEADQHMVAHLQALSTRNTARLERVRNLRVQQETAYETAVRRGAAQHLLDVARAGLNEQREAEAEIETELRDAFDGFEALFRRARAEGHMIRLKESE